MPKIALCGLFQSIRLISLSRTASLLYLHLEPSRTTLSLRLLYLPVRMIKYFWSFEYPNVVGVSLISLLRKRHPWVSRHKSVILSSLPQLASIQNHLLKLFTRHISTSTGVFLQRPLSFLDIPPDAGLAQVLSVANPPRGYNPLHKDGSSALLYILLWTNG